MKRSDFKTVDEYISTFPKDVQKTLQTIRRTIKKAVPKGTKEAISYQIPVYKLNDNLIFFAAYKNHVSIYPRPRNDEFNKLLSKYKGGKGTIQFPKGKPIPLSLITKVVKYRIKQSSAGKNHIK